MKRPGGKKREALVEVEEVEVELKEELTPKQNAPAFPGFRPADSLVCPPRYSLLLHMLTGRNLFVHVDLDLISRWIPYSLVDNRSF